MTLLHVVSCDAGLGPTEAERDAAGAYDLVSYYLDGSPIPLPVVAKDTNSFISSGSCFGPVAIRVDTLYGGTLTLASDRTFTETWTFFGRVQTGPCEIGVQPPFDERKQRTITRETGSWEIGSHNTLIFDQPTLLGTSPRAGISVAQGPFVTGQKLSYNSALYQRR